MKDREARTRRQINIENHFKARLNIHNVKDQLLKLDKCPGFAKNKVNIANSSNSIDYYFNSENPEILLVSLVHGDEPDSAYYVAEYLREHHLELPPLLYIPIASPSAAQNGTESNQWGNNLNRAFKDGSNDNEAGAIKKILAHFNNIRAAYTFHSDEQLNQQYYFYELGEPLQKSAILALHEKAAQANIRGFTGTDDPHDKSLDYLITKGHRRPILSPEEGFLEDFMVGEGIVKTAITFETPYTLTQNQIRHLIKAYFDKIIIPSSKL